ncbi:MAG: hypothetical protein AB3N20_17140 [Rhizobiaceae bacterium]
MFEPYFHQMPLRLVFWAVLATLASSVAGAAEPVSNDVGTVFWHPDEAHCRFVRSGAVEPNPEKPESWRYIFVTELISDDISSTERGYMRLGGLLRELEFLDRRETASGEVRQYKTLGQPSWNIEVDMRAGESRKSKLGQTVFFEYTGTVSVSVGHSQRLVPFTGSCGVEPEKLK